MGSKADEPASPPQVVAVPGETIIMRESLQVVINSSPVLSHPMTQNKH